MQVINPNNIKIYNLSAGKTLPEWISDKAKRNLQKKDIDIRRRIELIQNFEMPMVSNCIAVTPDKEHVCVTGMYKPTLKCFDVNQLSLKFERCMDEEVAQMKIISQDYSKIVFLQVDRFVEIHAQDAKYYRIRLPRVGRDFRYHQTSCDLYFVGKSDEIYRLNLEQGKFVTSLQTIASETNCCDLNPEHDLFACGTIDGTVECFDPRTRRQVAKLDCSLEALEVTQNLQKTPSITTLKFKDGLNMAVGTSSGHVLLYDIRSKHPLLIKDHNYGLPIKSIHFHKDPDLVLSNDSHILKLWDRNTGKAFTSIEPGTNLNTSCPFPDSGLIFIANDAPKILSYYIPSLGPAPKWCSFLDNLTEELEEDPEPTVYDDFKFVTTSELESLHLNHLIGSKLLRAYMHGYFIDVKLYNKAKALTQPFHFDDYKKSKLKKKIEQEKKDRVKIKKLPSVNKVLAEKLIIQEKEGNQKQKSAANNLLRDERFSKMFKDSSFQVDEQSEEFRLINPVVSKIGKSKDTKLLVDQFEEIDDVETDSSDDNKEWVEQIKKQYRDISKKNKLDSEIIDDKLSDKELEIKTPKFMSLKNDVNFEGDIKKAKEKRKLLKKTIGELMNEEKSEILGEKRNISGDIELTFTLKKNEKDAHRKLAMKEHRNERKKIRRSAGNLSNAKVKTNYWRKSKGT